MRFPAAISVVLPWLAISSAAIVKRQSESTDDDDGEFMCAWVRPQSAQIQDKLYMERGMIEFQKPDMTEDERLRLSAPRPVLYYLDLKQPFETTGSSNALEVIGTMEKKGYDLPMHSHYGHIMSNDYSYVSFGGSLERTKAVDVSEYPAKDQCVIFDAHQSEPIIPRPANETFRRRTMDNNVSRYVMEGAYASAPSENLGWVFGGSKRSDDGELRMAMDFYANDTTALMIEANLKPMRSETFKNIKTSVTPRALAEMVWLPTSETGALVLIGGTSMNYQQRLKLDKFSKDQVETWTEEGQKFMKYVSIYDPENDEWYEQKTSGDFPPPTADFCSVVATSKNKDSHQIYIYGGYSGISIGGLSMSQAEENVLPIPETTYDTAYVLSIPSFVWTQVRDGNPESPNAGRLGHRCHKVADNSMLIVGGYSPNCVDGILRSFNLNSLEFDSKYHPDNAAAYRIPAKIYEKVGGNADGGETPVKFSEKGLETLLTTPYSKLVRNYWPFEALAEKNTEGSSTTTDGSGDDDSEKKGSGLPSYVPPLLGSILGLLVVGCILALVLYYLRRRRRTIKRLQSDSAASTVVKKRQTWSWLMNTKEGAEKGSIHEYDSTPNTEPTDLYDGSTAYGSPTMERTNPMVNEAPESQIYEMPASSVAQELPTARTTKSVTIDEHVQEIGTREPISPLSPRPSVNKGSLKH